MNVRRHALDREHPRTFTALDGSENGVHALRWAVEEAERRAAGMDAVIALLDLARGADVLVVGSRGLGGFAGLLLGSASSQCVQHAPCPVVVVPERSTVTDR